MTNNERKIFEILGVKTDNRKNSKEILNECSFVDRCSYQTALEMAEWKDKQFAKHGYTKEQLREMGFAFTLNGDIVTPKEEKEMQVQYFKYKEQQMIDKASK